MGGRMVRTAGLVAVALIAAACSAAPAPPRAAPLTTQRKPRPAAWLADALAERIRLYSPKALIEVPEPGVVRVRLDPGQIPVKVFAARAAGPCAINAEFCEAALDRLATKALEVAEHERYPIDPESIGPYVVQTSDPDSLNSLTEETMVCVSRPIGRDLHVIYSWPAPTGTRYVRQRDLIRLRLDADRLHARAVTNLERYESVIHLVPLKKPRGVWTLEGRDGRRVFPEALTRERFWLDAARDMPGDLVVLIHPMRQLLVATTAEPGAIDYLISEGRNAERFGRDLQLYVWQGDWQPYQP